MTLKYDVWSNVSAPDMTVVFIVKWYDEDIELWRDKSFGGNLREAVRFLKDPWVLDNGKGHKPNFTKAYIIRKITMVIFDALHTDSLPEVPEEE